SARAGRGGSASLRVTRFVSSWVAWGFELGADAFLKHKTLSVQGTTSRDASFEAMAAYAGLFGRVNLFENNSWSPYVLGGGGYDRLSVRASAPVPVCWPVAQTCSDSVNAASMGLYLTGGGGVEFRIFKDVSLSLEGRLRRFGVDGKKLAAGAQSLDATFGATFWF
ncbi:MAG: hypothetical protein KGL53_07505, partial [Elusimicrobia bacterium]|nr:hypothetical protein [Elusimicrobiota bacterium]